MARILIVDDEPQVREVLRRMVERDGHVVHEAEDASSALRDIKEQTFDLVLCDVNMPGGSGLDLARAILSDEQDMAVVMVTGEDSRILARVALDAGAYGYLIKPFRPSEVMINIDNALRRRALEIEARIQREDLVRTLNDRSKELGMTLRQVAVGDARLQESFEQIIHRLALAAELKDEETAQHVERMSRYSGLIAQRMGYGEERTKSMVLAARMHDVGKIGVTDRVLRKRGALTDAEWAIMKGHPAMGFRMLAGTGIEILDLAADVARSHHEWFDGSGYPEGLSGTDIPEVGRIAAVADAFDALTTARPYRAALPIEKAVEIMQGEKGHFDPDILAVFLDVLPDAAAIFERLRDD
jgi:putative two-component system response regulator